MDICEPEKRSNTVGFFKTGTNHKDTSTCGGFHSIGSDLTRTREKAEIQQNDSIRSEQNAGRQGNTPMSKLEDAPSRESNAQGKENNLVNGRSNSEGDNAICS